MCEWQVVGLLPLVALKLVAVYFELSRLYMYIQSIFICTHTYMHACMHVHMCVCIVRPPHVAFTSVATMASNRRRLERSHAASWAILLLFVVALIAVVVVAVAASAAAVGAHQFCYTYI